MAVFGVGGLGHLALQYAKIAGAAVVAVDITEDKLRLARELGADYTINASEQNAGEEVKKLGGADAAIDTAVSTRASEQAYGSLKRGGTLVFVGLPRDGHISLPIFPTVLNGITVKGSIVGTRLDLQEVFELHAMGKTKVIHEERNLDSVNECFKEVESGKVSARLVFDMGVSEPARQSETVLTQEAESPGEQPTGTAGEHSGPMPG